MTGHNICAGKAAHKSHSAALPVAIVKAICWGKKNKQEIKDVSPDFFK
jgi:hypothetical protein